MISSACIYMYMYNVHVLMYVRANLLVKDWYCRLFGEGPALFQRLLAKPRKCNYCTSAYNFTFVCMKKICERLKNKGIYGELKKKNRTQKYRRLTPSLCLFEVRDIFDIILFVWCLGTSSSYWLLCASCISFLF